MSTRIAAGTVSVDANNIVVYLRFQPELTCKPVNAANVRESQSAQTVIRMGNPENIDQHYQRGSLTERLTLHSL